MLGQRADVREELRFAHQLIDAMPLTTQAYGTAMNRLRNVQRYLDQCETGAAGYELRMLAGALRSSPEFSQ